MDKQVEIVNYHPDYEESLAEMWNRSQEAWGGGTSVTTGDQVRRDEENSDSLAVFLAVYDNQVVGYCSLSEYTEDEGALYIHLLNVRPDYHGKKIGKMLVLRAVEETVHRGWPRVDLYTWESNMKAVPLYKRCGFFWEDREDTTHFMNFIPQIINCEAILPYMADIDWYADSSRTIEVVRDGHVENGFHTYTYTWNKNGRKLRVDIERRGRGSALSRQKIIYCQPWLRMPNPYSARNIPFYIGSLTNPGPRLELSLRVNLTGTSHLTGNSPSK
ncbi:hypothetical protein B7C51_02140 [Paenibacillus larvae subsp. pulvifaciens]|uniref:N-acetyltransferase domain-containing protein n=1 Tax=Paenibacillus larvae subsp. pulvifaciens TaxID=1477 RepID=A0A1V0UP56_9BACL|nr:GNAT family N-acetyltransferase [Paenibacillus larvae]ARF66866.1 hypothetical protein B7C51_02140 [Paenibacillus larvae subsp. pulvifaciens]